MKIEIVRKFHFSAGHRVYQHESKCANMHGHNYVLWVYARAKELDHLGRVIDFSVLKERIGEWLATYWDHTFLYYDQDKELVELAKIAPQLKPWFVCSFNPTAENMGGYLMKDVFPKLFSELEISIEKIDIYETENCKVVVEK